ncbi:NAD(P)/FAD-dependent oxidoreductase [Mycolicibacterium poriferae]|uniref:NAD(P)/FAD-dependent oxidoreductase n=1 Tax=Mycolicibacterium poriferae TaxID=39694 RepID=UPI0024BA61EF|nr:FAD/NAD(P)-binding oxidoreductase [Mycolicibacterium poriferae]
MSDSGLVVLGSGPAGVAAAEAYRERRPDAPVRILSADRRRPYARPPLSKEFLRGKTDDIDLHPEQWFTERDIVLALDSRVQGFDPQQRVVTVDGEPHGYDALIFATGSSPVPLPVPGGQHALQLRSLDDAERLRAAAESARTAVVVGAGFIGCEAAASLALRGLSVTLVAPDEAPQQKRLGVEAGRKLAELVEASGARWLGGASVERLDESVVHLDSGETLEADLILAATGVRPNTELAGVAGVPMQDSRIVADEDLSTGLPQVYAAGDVALAFNTGAGRRLPIEHWQDAEDQGKVAGATAAGDDAAWSGVPGFWTTIGDTTVKYHAWGDGYQDSRMVEHGDGFTVWYEADGAVVAVLTCNADDDYDLGGELIQAGKPAPLR